MAVINGDGKTKTLKGLANEPNTITGSDLLASVFIIYESAKKLFSPALQNLKVILELR